MLRKLISWAVERFYPKHCFYGREFLGDAYEDYTTDDLPVKLSLFLCNSLTRLGRLQVGDTLTMDFGETYDKDGPVGSYTVTIKMTAAGSVECQPSDDEKGTRK
jgi:hypothetical protein